MFYKEELNTPVTSECDVLVCGGGFGGVAAALAAARQNKKVILLERQFILGGLATAGLVTIYLALCDGLGKQVSFGIAEELIKLSVSIGAESDLGRSWWANNGEEKKGRYESKFNPQIFAIQTEQLLLDAGVTVLYGTTAVRTVVEDGKITAVIVENKSGRSAISVKSVVDATGDADIAYLAGADCELFKQGNVLASWYYAYSKSHGYELKTVGFCDVPDKDKKPGQEIDLLSSRRFTGVDATEVSEYTIASHASLLNHLLEYRKTAGEDCLPVTMPTIPQLRMTRRLKGEYELDDAEMHVYFEDSIGMVSDWRKPGPVYEVPFRTLYSKKIKNLIMAGRCTSVTEPMWDIMRVIPCCAVTGEAAGIASALTDDFSALDISLLQAKLVEAGVVLHEKDIK